MSENIWAKNTVTASFNTAVRQTTKMFRDQNVSAKYDWNISVTKTVTALIKLSVMCQCTYKKLDHTCNIASGQPIIVDDIW